jgi:hypothetical protein
MRVGGTVRNMEYMQDFSYVLPVVVSIVLL